MPLLFAFRSVACTLAAASLIASTLPSFAEDFSHYTNPRFGVTGLVPAGFQMQLAPENNDGRRFVAADGQAEVVIYGSYDAMGPLSDYRAYLTAQYAEIGEITYQPVGADWFVLSGLMDERIFYLRVEQGSNCDGDLVYAHMYLGYAQQAKAQIDPLVGAMAKGLGVADC